MTSDHSAEIAKNLGHDPADITSPPNTVGRDECEGASACNTSVLGATPEHDVYTPTSACTAMTKKGKPCSAPTCAEAREQELNFCSGHLIATARAGSADMPKGWAEGMSGGRGKQARAGTGMPPEGSLQPTRSGEGAAGLPHGYAIGRVADVKRTRKLNVALPEEELHELWDKANIAIGQLMAGLVGRREWDDDVMELYNVFYDDICGNGFTANLYNAVTMPLGLFPFRSDQRLWRGATSWVWDPDEFRELADEVRAQLIEEGWTPPSKR